MAKTKALISFAVPAKLICAFVFACADCWFSHVVAHIIFHFFDNLVSVKNNNTYEFKVDNHVTKINYCVLVFGQNQ